MDWGRLVLASKHVETRISTYALFNNSRAHITRGALLSVEAAVFIAVDVGMVTQPDAVPHVTFLKQSLSGQAQASARLHFLA
mmetsp:Transcript_147366/g.282423  ORF Transcript_147366/g.282423 Transcript_147366/m.282423 type:complete len:82 (+) Transcript_147366:185-430(+)